LETLKAMDSSRAMGSWRAMGSETGTAKGLAMTTAKGWEKATVKGWAKVTHSRSLHHQSQGHTRCKWRLHCHHRTLRRHDSSNCYRKGALQSGSGLGSGCRDIPRGVRSQSSLILIGRKRTWHRLRRRHKRHRRRTRTSHGTQMNMMGSGTDLGTGLGMGSGTGSETSSGSEKGSGLG